MVRIAKTLISLALILYCKTLSAQIVVAVIDTGIDPAIPNLCKVGHKSFTTNSSDPLQDNVGHGTHLAGLITSIAGAGDYCILSIKYSNTSKSSSENAYDLVKAIQYAVSMDVNFINISGGGIGPSTPERIAIEDALNKHIVVVTAAGNEGMDLDKGCIYYPACYDKRIIVVGNLRDSSSSERYPTSNYGVRVNRWEVGHHVKSNLPGGRIGYMGGTSQAAAIATGKLLLETLNK